MQTITVEITNTNALKALHTLEEKRFIRIVDESNVDSPALPGSRLALSAFKNWISMAEKADTIGIKEAKSKWQSKKKRLQKPIK